MLKKESSSQQYSASIGQRSLWYIHALGDHAAVAYNEPMIFRLTGQLSLEALNNAFDLLIKKHAILRTLFKQTETGEIIQIVNDRIDFTITLLPETVATDDVIEQQINTPFNLESAPLLRVSLIKLADQDHILTIIQHHIITDGLSSAILIKDLSRFYNQSLTGNNSEFLHASKTYVEHVEMSINDTSTAKYQEKLNKFVDNFTGYSGLNFLTTIKQNNKPNLFAGDRVYFTLPTVLYQQLKQFCTHHKVTPFHFLLSTFCVWLQKFTRTNDIVIGAPFANRGNDPELDIMGYFINTLPLRVTLESDSTFNDIVKYIKKTALNYLGKQDLPLEQVTSRYREKASTHKAVNLVQTLFNWSQNAASLSPNFNGICAKSESTYYPKSAKFDISLFMSEENKQYIEGYFEFKTALFDKSLIQKLTKHLIILVEHILEHPEHPLSSLSLLDKNEKRQMKALVYNAKTDIIVHDSLVTLFQKTVEHYQNNIGLAFQDNEYNYKTIDTLSTQWAYFIRQRYQALYNTAMPKGTLIGICIDRCEDMVFALLGVLKAGAAYVPIDPNYPKERIEYIINDSNADLLLTHSTYQTLCSGIKANKLIYMDDQATLESLNQFNNTPLSSIDPKSLAYVLYTSGSTGKPKAVGVTHENVICLFGSLKKQFSLSHEDIWSLYHTFCFDISVWEIWGAFLFGGKLVVIPYNISRDPTSFYQLLKTQNVSVLSQTASAFQMLITEDLKHEGKLDNLRYIAFVGESLKVSILRPWVAKYGTDKPRLANMYGITETTVYTNYKFITQNDIDAGRDNIGWPLEAFSMFILDEHLEWCPVGIVGEIYIGGRGLSQGYIHRSDLTHEKFITNPHAEFLGLNKQDKLYKTGDLGRWQPDGSIEYLGRKDFQIKLRGYRIELGEIEAALGSFKGITHTAVLLKGNDESARLIGYYTTIEKVEIHIESIKAHLQTFLPEYMIPQQFVSLNAFPITVNGKVDRQKLLQLKTESSDKIGNVSSDLSTTEMEIVNIWAKLLNIPPHHIMVDTNFFTLGGNSLLVVKMLAQISQAAGIDISLGQFIASPTIRNIASQNHLKYNTSQITLPFLKILAKDKHLESHIQPLQIENSYIRHPQKILLTGASGFLGAHVLNELLTTTSTDIICLSRSPSVQEAMNEIQKKFVKYGFMHNAFDQRITVVLGNIEEVNLGLNTQDFDTINQTIDAIFHVAAKVNHILDYQTLFNANVRSTLELLKICTRVKNKSLHFISTFGAQLISPFTQLPFSNKDDGLIDLNLNGYLSTKWVSEQLLKEAYLRGFKVQVYRPGNIIAGKNGVYESAQNHTLLRLKGFLQLKTAYVNEAETLEMMPVDLLAAEIINIAFHGNKFAYNLHNEEKITWEKYLHYATTFGFPVTMIDDKERWFKMIEKIDEENSLYSLSALYRRTHNNTPAKDTFKDHFIKPDHAINPPSYEKMIAQQFQSLKNSSFLEI